MKLEFTYAFRFFASAIRDAVIPNRSQANSTPRKQREKRQERRVSAVGPATIKWRQPDGELSTQEIAITDASSKGVGVRLPNEIAVGQTVTIAAQEDKEYRGVLRHCHRRDGEYSAGVLLAFRERRRNDRDPLSGGGTLSWADADGAHQEEQVRVLNLSNEGVQLEVPSPVPLSSIVRLSGTSEECFGCTCYCEPDGDTYLVGLHLIRQMGTEPFKRVEVKMPGGHEEVSCFAHS